MKYEQKAELQDSNKARMYEAKKIKVLKLNKPKKQYVETYQELNILATINGYVDLWHEHYPFKKWLTHKYFKEVDINDSENNELDIDQDNSECPDYDDFPDMDFCDEEIIQEWIDETHQPFKLMSMPDQRGFYFYE